MTVWAKRGSPMAGIAISIWPASEVADSSISEDLRGMRPMLDGPRRHASATEHVPAPTVTRAIAAARNAPRMPAERPPATAPRGSGRHSHEHHQGRRHHSVDEADEG